MTSDRPRAKFGELARFLDENPDWPGRRALLRNAERTMPKDFPDARVLAWFEARPAVSPSGARRHAEALQRSGETERATALIRKTWIDGDFASRDERAFRKRFAKQLRRADHLARLDRLLWQRKFRPAKRLARRLGKGHAALAEARMALARRSPGVDYAIRQVPQGAQTRSRLGLRARPLAPAQEPLRRRDRTARPADARRAPPEALVAACANGPPARLTWKATSRSPTGSPPATA